MISLADKSYIIYNKLSSLLFQLKNINAKTLDSLSKRIELMVVGENKMPMWANKSIQLISEEDLSGVTLINAYAFYNCTSLTSIIIPDSVTTIGNSAFSDCTSLTSITMPDSVTSIGSNAFYGCTNLTSITIPDSVTSIGSRVFYGTSYFNNAENWQDNILYIDKYMVGISNKNLSTYNIKNGTVLLCDSAFNSCTNLTSITIPDSVTSIGEAVFHSCRSLTSITIPDNVTSIGSYAFYNCNRLKHIYLNPTIPPSLLGDTRTIPSTTTIHVPIGSGNAYKSATNWSYHSDRIVEDIQLS